MTYDEFISCMKLIKGVYGWEKIDLTDRNSMSIWFMRCQPISYARFKQLVSLYCQHKDFPPRSPNELATYPLEIYRSQYPSMDEERELVMAWTRKYHMDEYSKAMKHCPPLIETIPISKWRWDSLLGEDWERETKRLLTEYECRVKEMVTEKGRRFLKGEIPLPYTKSGKLIDYLAEANGVKDDKALEADKERRDLIEFMGSLLE